MSDREIKIAVDAARAQGHQFVFVPPSASPELQAALAGLASETGRELIFQNTPPAISLAAGDVPTIARSDKRGFLKNLEAIARGDAKVQ